MFRPSVSFDHSVLFVVIFCFVIVAMPGVAQENQTAAAHDENPASPEQLQSVVLELRNQLQQSRTELQQLRQRVSALEARVGTPAVEQPAGSLPTLASPAPAAPVPADDTLRSLREGQELLSARVNEQEQTGVESTSQYKVKLSGLILMNASANQGRVDIQDLPGLAFTPGAGRSGGDFGATLRQSLLGLEVFGPKLAGASSSAGVEVDFFGGFPRAPFGVSSALMRLRTAHARLDWTNTSVAVGQEAPFFSPLSPTSYASVAEPAFAWAGNLWVWTPQISVEHRWATGENSGFSLQGGILDALTEGVLGSQVQRTPSPGEASRYPAAAGRLGWSGTLFGHNAQAGVGTYVSSQNYGFDRNTRSWAWTADWNLPLAPILTWSGEMFRGQALGGLGGGVWNSIVADQPTSEPGASIAGLNTIGGWSQLKLAPSSRWELNLAAGMDNPFSSDIERFAQEFTVEGRSPLARNQAAFLNAVYRPRSNLLVALEYRRLRTYFRNGDHASAGHINLAIGVSF
jgi:hypothetical protein